MASDESPGPAELAAAGLYDADAPDAPQRLALLEYLVSLGATLDDLGAAHPEALPLLASTIALWGDREFVTIDDVARETGAEPQLIARAWRASGFPEPSLEVAHAPFSQRDVELIHIVRAGIELLGEDVTIQLLRVIGAAAARVANATVSAFVVNVGSAAVEQDPSGLALARANAESMVMLDGLTRGFDTLLRHHMERSFRPFGAEEGAGGAGGVDLVHRSVGFADLVESTAWSEGLDLRLLSRALTRFDATASEIVVGLGGRVVKLIGDEVMFVADDASAAADIGLALIDTFAADEVLPTVRVGVATGDVLARDGDFSGPVVNLAARIVKIAAPSTLLVDPATRASLDGAPSLVCGETGTHSLKGFADPVPVSRVTRPA